MKRPRLSRETLAALDAEGLHVSSLRQIPQNDNRKLKPVAEPGDPWVAQLFAGDTNSAAALLQTEFISWGEGPTADDAVMSALLKGRGLQGRLRMLAAELERLLKLLRHARS